MIAAAANGLRLWLWRGLATRKEPIVWILHVGYAWIVCGLALTAAAHLTGGIAQSLAHHAFGAGSITRNEFNAGLQFVDEEVLAVAV